jgi:hypothetical protein
MNRLKDFLKNKEGYNLQSAKLQKKLEKSLMRVIINEINIKLA